LAGKDGSCLKIFVELKKVNKIMPLCTISGWNCKERIFGQVVNPIHKNGIHYIVGPNFPGK
jgi:hypothetical protein